MRLRSSHPCKCPCKARRSRPGEVRAPFSPAAASRIRVRRTGSRRPAGSPPLGQTTETGRARRRDYRRQRQGRRDDDHLVAPRGSLTLRLNRTGPAGLRPLPTTLSYTITAGTRGFRNAVGSGAIDVTLNPSVFSDNVGLITLNFHVGVSADRLIGVAPAWVSCREVARTSR